MTADRQRHRVVEEIPHILNDSGTAHRVVFCGALASLDFGDYIASIQRIVQTAPTRVGGVQGVAGIVHRHNQLRPGNGGDFGIDIFGLDGKIIALTVILRQQIADVSEMGFIRRNMRPAGVIFVPRVDLLLQRIAFFQQGAVLSRQVGDNRGQASPEFGGLNPAARRDFVGDKIVQFPVDAQAALFDSVLFDFFRHLAIIH